MKTWFWCFAGAAVDWLRVCECELWAKNENTGRQSRNENEEIRFLKQTEMWFSFSKYSGNNNNNKTQIFFLGIVIMANKQKAFHFPHFSIIAVRRIRKWPENKNVGWSSLLIVGLPNVYLDHLRQLLYLLPKTEFLLTLFFSGWLLKDVECVFESPFITCLIMHAANTINLQHTKQLQLTRFDRFTKNGWLFLLFPSFEFFFLFFLFVSTRTPSH